MAIVKTKEGKLLTDGDMTGDITSDSVYLGDWTKFVVYAVWTGSDAPVGNSILQGSIDGTNYFTVQTQAAGAAGGSKVWQEADVAYSYFRVFWDFTSDATADTLNVWYRAKR